LNKETKNIPTPRVPTMSTIRSTRKTEISSNQDSFLFLVFFKAVTLKKEKATMKTALPMMNILKFIE
tara:strand:- start:289 stop:489 length:201 start_codon:yes stop_codon:yes gene_type:complete